MSFEQPAPDRSKIIAAWEEWENGEETPGRVGIALCAAQMLIQKRQQLENAIRANASHGVRRRICDSYSHD